MTDAALMARTSLGDHVAFTELHQRHAQWADAYARRTFNGSRVRPGDIVQEAFVELWRTAGRYDSERGSLRSWLALIVRHRGIDAVRRPHLATVGLDAIADVASDDAPVEVLVHRAMVGTQVTAAMRRLPPRQHEVLRLAYFEELSQTEIARRTGAPLGTVKGRVRLAIERLDTAELHADVD